MARWDDASYGASAVRDYGSRVGVACFFAGLAFGVVFVVIGAGGGVRAIGASVLAVAALINALRAVRRAPSGVSPVARADTPDVAYFETRLADGDRALRLSPPHGSRTFQ